MSKSFQTGLVLGISCLVVFFLLLFLSVRLNPLQSFNSVVAALLLNLATGVLVVAVSVGIIDRLLERAQHREAEEAKELRGVEANRQSAMRKASRLRQMLCDVVWVWQGGIERADPAQTLAVLNLVDANDPVHRVTQSRLMQLGSAAQRRKSELQPLTNAALSRSFPDIQEFDDALSELMRLRGIRQPGRTVMPAKEITACLTAGLKNLNKALDDTPDVPAPRKSVQAFHSASSADQQWRAQGKHAKIGPEGSES